MCTPIFFSKSNELLEHVNHWTLNYYFSYLVVHLSTVFDLMWLKAIFMWAMFCKEMRTSYQVCYCLWFVITIAKIPSWAACNSMINLPLSYPQRSQRSKVNAYKNKLAKLKICDPTNHPNNDYYYSFIWMRFWSCCKPTSGGNVFCVDAHLDSHQNICSGCSLAKIIEQRAIKKGNC